MNIPLETWYILRDLEVAEDRLEARFVPDYFHAEMVDPVVTLSVDTPSNASDAKNIFSRFAEEPLVELDVSAQKIELWAEYDDVPSVIHGESATWQRAAYLPEDLFRIIGHLSSQLEGAYSQVVGLRKHQNEAESFVAELLHRAEAKKALTTRPTTAVDAQIQVLERILCKLRDA